MKLLYVDTSALFKRYVEEDESEAVLGRMEEAPVVGSRLEQTLAVLEAAEDARRFNGPEFEDAVLRHAQKIPAWEIARRWRYQDWPGRTPVDATLPPHDAGIDVVAVKHDGSRRYARAPRACWCPQ